MDFKELQSDVDYLKKDAETIVHRLHCAEKSETLEDFRANLSEATRDLEDLTRQVAKMHVDSQEATNQ